MRLNTSYKQILAISLPIMLGSAAQNIVVLSDNVFLYHLSPTDFASIGIVGVFYLIVAAIGFGFSRGGQILIARMNGSFDYDNVGRYFKSLLIFETLLALGMFLFLQYGSQWFFSFFVDDPVIQQKCIEYIIPRSYGVFFSYLGVTLIALYTGIARTKFIIFDTLLLGVINIFLNYVLIFGKFGFESMGIAGAGWASTIAEMSAFVVFVIYMLFDKKIRKYNLLAFNGLNLSHIYRTFSISSPIVFQSILGLGSWFIFFSFIENMSNKALEISNLIRNVYLILSIPCWGYSSAINTIVSNFIGNNKRQAVLPMIWKTTYMNMGTTLAITIPIILFPTFFLDPLFGSEEFNLIAEAKPYFPVLVAILLTFAWGSTFMNGLIGTGHTKTALLFQFLGTVVYVVYAHYVVNVWQMNLGWAWAAEIFYWGGILIACYFYLMSKDWHKPKF